MRARHLFATAVASAGILVSLGTPTTAWSQTDPAPPLGFAVISSAGSTDSLFAGDSLRLSAGTCAPCGRFTGAAVRDGVPTFEIDVRPDSCLITVCLPQSRDLPLGAFAAGTHRIVAEAHLRFLSPSGIRRDTVRTELEFTVRERVKPPADSLPYGLRVCVGMRAAGEPCQNRVCPGDGVLVTLDGAFPTTCYRVRSFGLSPSTGPFETLRLEVMRCGDACAPMHEPFRRQELIGPATPGEQRIRLLVIERECEDSSVVARSWTSDVRYSVPPNCSTSAPCVFPYLTAPATQTCAAFLSPAGEAGVDFGLQSGAPVAGLEGDIDVQAPLVVSSVDAIGAAQGMRALWHRTDTGARWTLFGLDGRQLPPLDGERVLRVKVSVPTDGPLPDRMRVAATVAVASDSLGGKVPICDIQWMRIADPAAIVCARTSCDMNGDGLENVRDLVGMVRCLRLPEACPDSVLRPDCDHDGVFGLDDVLCCARRILRGAGADTLPPRPGDGLALRFGEPVRSANGVEVPLHLSSGELLGDTRLVLAYPADRFEFESADLEGDAAGWLSFAESRTPGRVTLALVNMGGTERTLPLRLFLRLRPGALLEGQVTVDEDESRGVDGARLTTVLSGTASAALGTAMPRPVGLSLARPNPFGGTTRFTVTLASSADAEVSVHDIAGRQVTSLHRGRLEPGSRDFAWDGRDANGSRVAGGLYFVRLRVGGAESARTVVLLGTR